MDRKPRRQTKTHWLNLLNYHHHVPIDRQDLTLAPLDQMQVVYEVEGLAVL